MGKETLPAVEAGTDKPKEAQKDVKPIDPVAQKEASDERKVAEFTSEILENPTVFLEKIQNNHDFANTNRDAIIKAIARVQKPILDDRDRIEKELWNKSLY